MIHYFIKFSSWEVTILTRNILLNETCTGRRGVYSQVIGGWQENRVHPSSAVFGESTWRQQHLPRWGSMTHAQWRKWEDGGVTKAFRQLWSRCQETTDTTLTQPATHQSVNTDCSCLLFVHVHRAVYGGRGVPADPITQQTNQACNAQAKTCTGENVSGDLAVYPPWTQRRDEQV